MGYYINPVGSVTNFDKWDIISDKVHIVEVENFAFSAVGIAVDLREASTMSDPRDKRPKKYGYISWDDLKKVDPMIYNSAKRVYKV
jgi:hypothetical protein